MSHFLRCLPLAALACLLAPPPASAGTVQRTFTDRGASVFTVPPGVTSVRIVAVGEAGARGGNSPLGVTPSAGGRGARVQGNLEVSPGQQLHLNVGVGGGQPGFLPGSGAGGGASDVRLCPAAIPDAGCAAVPAAGTSLATRVLVAGGGGGGGANLALGVNTNAAGGNGGDAGPVNAAGLSGQTIGARFGGGGGTLSAGGAGGFAPARAPGSPGELGRGGDGGVEFNKVTGAGGGGGLYGGGGSASSETLLGGPVAGGGGGSSFASAAPLPGAAVSSTVTGATSSISPASDPPSVTISYDDDVAPVVSITSPADGQVVGSRPTIRGTAGTLDGDATDVTIVTLGPGGPGPTFTAPVATDGTFAATLPTPLSAGGWQLAVQQTDDGGNLTSEKLNLTVDAVAPLLTLAAPGDGALFSTTTPTFRGVAGTKPKDEPTVRMRVFAGAGSTGAPAATVDAAVGPGGAYTATSPALADGRYTVTASQRDDGQNETTTPGASFVVDTAAPTIDLSFGDGTEVGVGGVLGLSYSCADGGSGVASCDGSRASGAPVPTGAPGTFAETVTATDRAGNTATRTVTYVVRAPAAAVSGGACPGTGACAPSPVRVRAGLRVASVKAGQRRRGKVTVTVRGTVAKAAVGQRLRVRATRGTRRITRSVTLRRTSWRVTLTLPARAGRWRVTATLPGNATVIPATARRTLRLR